MSVFPSTWKTIPLDQVAIVQTGISKSAKRIASNMVTLPYLRVANVQDGHLNLSVLKTIEVPEDKVERYSVYFGDILLTEGGDFDKLGRGCVWRGEVENCVHQNHVFVVRPNRDRILPEFLSALCASKYGRDYFLSCAKQTTNLASINSTQLKEFPLLVPPLQEQGGICSVMCVWDRAINLTEQLIAEKKEHRKGLMQQLLTGKHRLLGFDGEWREVQLGEVFERVQRSIPEAKKPEVLSITAKVGFVSQREKFSKVIAGKNLVKYVLIQRGEFSYNKGNSKTYTQGCVFRLKEFDEGAVPNVFYSFKVVSDEAHAEFYEHFFAFGGLNHQLSRVINTGVRNDGLLNLNARDFFAVRVPLPPLDEQQRIAEVLSHANIELDLLQDKADALREQKKGLMQQLLTGKIRLKV